MEASSPRFIPGTTSPLLKGLLILLGLSSILSGLFFRTLFPLLALSRLTLQEGWAWQLITYPFSLQGPLNWWSLGLLTLQLFILWSYSAPLIEKNGIKSYFVLFFGSTCFAGLAALIGLWMSPSILTGFAPVLFAVLLSWLLLFPHATMRLFGYLLNARVVIELLLCFDLLIHLSQEHWTPFLANSGGALFAYCYVKSLQFFQNRRSKSLPSPKIYDIHSGRPVLDDDQFMDAMLARISLHGEESLTPKEKKRMQEISEKKSKKM